MVEFGLIFKSHWRSFYYDENLEANQDPQALAEVFLGRTPTGIPAKAEDWYAGYSVNLNLQNGHQITAAYLRFESHTGAHFGDALRYITFRNIDNGEEVYSATADGVADWFGTTFSATLLGPGASNQPAITMINVTQYLQAILNRSGWEYGNFVNVRVEWDPLEAVELLPDDFDSDRCGLIIDGIPYFGPSQGLG